MMSSEKMRERDTVMRRQRPDDENELKTTTMTLREQMSMMT